MIEFKDVSLTFGEDAIFRHFNARISSGSSVCISGESGRGKSSLLKLVMGQVIPNSGTILIDGLEVSQKTIEQARSKIAWVPQNINLPVNNGIELIGLLQIEAEKTPVSEYLKQLDLDSDLLSREFSEISGGQKQRIVISVVLCLNKPILLMDEPTSSLDERSINSLATLVNSLKETTIISASHNQAWLSFSDEIIEL